MNVSRSNSTVHTITKHIINYTSNTPHNTNTHINKYHVLQCTQHRISLSYTTNYTQSHRYQHTQQQPDPQLQPPQNNNNTTNSQHRTKKSNKRYIFLGVLGSYIVYAIYQLHDEQPAHYSWKLAVVKTFPLRLLSRIWGYVNHLELPIFMRKPLYNLWINAFGVRVEDFAVDDISVYKNLAEFFSRPIRSDVRTIDNTVDLVAPCDSRITAFGEVDVENTIEQIKGMTYSLTDLLGFNPLDDPSVNQLNYSSKTLHEAHRTILQRKFYYVVLYLHPGDYHRYHSPTECIINARRHYPGQLMPVAPSFAQWVPKLFSRQERVVLSGAWKHGFFSYIPVGAYNVGGMKLNFDPQLVTNNDTALHSYHNGVHYKQYSKSDSTRVTQYPGVELHRGDEIGYFELGSTVVLIFEVPVGHEFNWAIGRKAEKAMEVSVQKDLAILEPAGIRVRLGQALGSVDKVVREEQIVDGILIPKE